MLLYIQSKRKYYYKNHIGLDRVFYLLLINCREKNIIGLWVKCKSAALIANQPTYFCGLCLMFTDNKHKYASYTF